MNWQTIDELWNQAERKAILDGKPELMRYEFAELLYAQWREERAEGKE